MNDGTVLTILVVVFFDLVACAHPGPVLGCNDGR
jgi:hypothetical protein